ncbi:hypothetical protein [Amycolatopsis azurea]|uniref:hypothetical protein n=1 Tax=Amycolatopsis azurea TaxID=36819 RepID=UPI0011773A1C|nr:hypothetical protein [Amycolatopsis azurea]
MLDTLDDMPSALTRLSISLPGVTPSPHPILDALWDGLGLARACGLAAASADPSEWVSRQRNADTIEYLLARELIRTNAACDQSLTLRPVTSPGEARSTAWAATVIQTILDFTNTAQPMAHATADTATHHDDQHHFRTSANLLGELGACWRGERPAYQLHTTDRTSSPWWNHHPHNL